MSRRLRSRQVEIFNFSFLDILACTIGLLIFIMVMVFILQSGSPVADISAIVDRKAGEAATLQEAAARDARIAAGLEAELGRVIVPDQPDLSPQRDIAEAARDAARHAYENAAHQEAEAQARLNEARLARDRSAASNLETARADLVAAHERNNRAQAALDAAMTPQDQPVVLMRVQRPGEGGQAFQVLHVDCHANQVILLKENGGKLAEVGRTGVKELASARSAFQQIAAAQRRLNDPLVLFWVRPDGAETYEAARAELPSGTPFGYEPADAAWTFRKTTP